MHLHLFRARKARPTSDGFVMDGETDDFSRSKPSEKKDISLEPQKGDETHAGPFKRTQAHPRSGTRRRAAAAAAAAARSAKQRGRHGGESETGALVFLSLRVLAPFLNQDRGI